MNCRDGASDLPFIPACNEASVFSKPFQVVASIKGFRRDYQIWGFRVLGVLGFCGHLKGILYTHGWSINAIIRI
jgi:hypothetical protein